MLFNNLNNKIDKNYLTKISKYISKNISIPTFLVNKFRTLEEIEFRKNSISKFDSLDTFIEILKLRLSEIKNIVSAIQVGMDRNSNKIEELEITKNNKIIFYEYSENFNSSDNPGGLSNHILSHSLSASSGQVEGIIADMDSGLEFTEQIIDNKSFIKINIEDSKLDGINFVSHSSVKMAWNPQLKAYEIFQNDIFQYDSETPESTIIIDHNLGTRALDIKTFKLLPNDLDLRYPIMPGIEYPSDNRVIIYLTNQQLVSVLISRI